jgi:hypothetical protein
MKVKQTENRKFINFEFEYRNDKLQEDISESCLLCFRWYSIWILSVMPQTLNSVSMEILVTSYIKYVSSSTFLNAISYRATRVCSITMMPSAPSVISVRKHFCGIYMTSVIRIGCSVNTHQTKPSLCRHSVIESQAGFGKQTFSVP